MEASDFKRRKVADETEPAETSTIGSNDKLVEIILNEYKKPKYAKLKRLLYEKEFPIAQNFINLALIKETEQKQKDEQVKTTNAEFRDSRINSFEDIHKPKEPIKIKDIFDQLKDNKKPNRILIEGRAGIGKTTLCQFIANQWAVEEGCLKTWREQFKLIIWLPLRELKDYADKKFQELSLAKIVFDRYCQYEEDISLEQVKNELEILQKTQKVLFLLDGYDELVPILQQAKYEGFKEFFERKILNLPHWILTSRPHYATNIKADKRLENIGFISADIPVYIHQFFKDLDKEAQAESLLKLLEKNKNIHGIAHIPINLELICSVWEQEGNNLGNNLNMTALYDKLVLNLFKRYLNKFNKEKITHLTWNDLLQYKKADCGAMLRFLEKVAFEGMRQPGIILSAALIKKIAGKLWPLETRETLAITALKDLGLLKGLGVSTTSVLDQEYYFIHLTFQEYFAARYVVNHLNKPKMQQFVSAHKLDKRYEIVWWFVSGLVKYDVSLLNCYFKIIFCESRDILRFNDLYLLINCLVESIPNEVNAFELINIWGHFKLSIIDDNFIEKMIIHCVSNDLLSLLCRIYDIDKLISICIENFYIEEDDFGSSIDRAISLLGLFCEQLPITKKIGVLIKTINIIDDREYADGYEIDGAFKFIRDLVKRITEKMTLSEVDYVIQSILENIKNNKYNEDLIDVCQEIEKAIWMKYKKVNVDDAFLELERLYNSCPEIIFEVTVLNSTSLISREFKVEQVDKLIVIIMEKFEKNSHFLYVLDRIGICCRLSVKSAERVVSYLINKFSKFYDQLPFYTIALFCKQLGQESINKIITFFLSCSEFSIKRNNNYLRGLDVLSHKIAKPEHLDAIVDICIKLLLRKPDPSSNTFDDNRSESINLLASLCCKNFIKLKQEKNEEIIDLLMNEIVIRSNVMPHPMIWCSGDDAVRALYEIAKIDNLLILKKKLIDYLSENIDAYYSTKIFAQILLEIIGLKVFIESKFNSKLFLNEDLFFELTLRGLILSKLILYLDGEDRLLCFLQNEENAVSISLPENKINDFVQGLRSKFQSKYDFLPNEVVALQIPEESSTDSSTQKLPSSSTQVNASEIDHVSQAGLHIKCLNVSDAKELTTHYLQQANVNEQAVRADSIKEVKQANVLIEISAAYDAVPQSQTSSNIPIAGNIAQAGGSPIINSKPKIREIGVKDKEQSTNKEEKSNQP